MGAEGPRRKRHRLVVVLAAVVVLIAAGSVVEISTYDPFEVDQGIFALEGPGHRWVRDEDRDLDVPSIEVRPNGTFTLTFTLTNYGTFGATVREVELEPSPFYRVTGIERGDPGGGKFESFAPFALAPERSRAVRMTLRFADCEPQDGRSVTISSTRVRFAIFGVPRTTETGFQMGPRIRGVGDPARCEEPFAAP